MVRILTRWQALVLFALWLADRQGRSDGITYIGLVEVLRLLGTHSSLPMVKKTIHQLKHWSGSRSLIEHAPDTSIDYRKGRRREAFRLNKTAAIHTVEAAQICLALFPYHEGEAPPLHEFRTECCGATRMSEIKFDYHLRQAEARDYVVRWLDTTEFVSTTIRTHEELPYLRLLAKHVGR
jgi:hypothetical protein